MKYTYRFVTGESVGVEVSAELEALLKNEDRLEYNNDHANTRRHVPLDTSKDGGADYLAVEDEDLQALVSGETDEERLLEALAYLKSEQRDLLHAVYFDRISVSEYAAHEGVDHSAISHRLRTAKKNLKKIFEASSH